jgi:hypothetical protein
MFEGRFHTDADALFGASWQMMPFMASSEGVDAVAAVFAQRQRNRRMVVGSSDWNSMERTLREVCEALRANLRAGYAFVFGQRPSNADFALFGQLRQLAADPFPAKIVQQYPEVWGWVWRMDDLSGYNPPDDDGQKPAAPTPATEALLRLIGQTYLPFLLANEKALLAGGKEQVRVSIFGGSAEHVQPPFKYQLLCIQTLRAQFARLAAADQAEVSVLLEQAGCPVSALHPKTSSGSSPRPRL